MKNSSITILLSSLALLFSFQTKATENAQDSVKMEVPVHGVFAPEYGFDDNDDVQLVIDGYLPNSCYQKTKTQVSVDQNLKVIQVTQLAKKEDSEICKDESTLPPEMKAPLSFMSEVEVGELPIGNYTVLYKSLEGIKNRKLNIEKAKTRTIDNAYYAITSNAYVKEVVDANQSEFIVNMTGYLNSPCVSISNKINGAYLNDVIILLPEVEKNGKVCPPVAQEFEFEMSLKTPPPGRYLLHIRSANGTAVNRLFTVK